MVVARIALAAAALSALAGCPRTDPCGEPHYGGQASDEAWLTMVDAEKRVTVDDAKAATMLEPAEGQVYASSAPAPKLRWSSPLSASSAPIFPASGPVRRGASITSFFIGEAWAHLPPVNGPVHVLEISLPNAQCPVRLFTTETSWQLPDDVWGTLKSAAGQSLSIETTSAYMRDNRITEGPYRGSAKRTFRVEP